MIPPEWLLRGAFASGAIVAGRACWRRRVLRENNQREKLTADLAERTRELAVEKQRAEEETRVKSQYLAKLSQELRTSLNGVLSMLELAQATDLRHEQQEYLQQSKDYASGALSLLGGTLDVSRVETKKWELKQVEFSLRSCISGVVMTAAAHTGESNRLALQTALQGSLPDRLVGDPDRLREVLLRVIKVVEKAVGSSAGKIVVSVNRDRRARENRSGIRNLPLFFSVQHSGIGASMGKPRAAGHGRHGDGADPGLETCGRLVRLLGGRIWIYSEKGQANKICFTAHFESPRPIAAEDRTALPQASQEHVH